MHRKSWQKDVALRALICLSVAVLVGIFFFGLRPKGFNSANNVHWLEDQAGLRFGRFGIAYTRPRGGVNKKRTEAFSIELALRPAGRQDGFSMILSLHGGNDKNQLLIGQWRSWIIAMNGDDYAHRRKTKRIAVDIAARPPAARLLTITTGAQGTRIYLDGHLQRTKQDLTLSWPAGGKTRLVVGNSVYGDNAWKGALYGLALYGYPLSAQDAARHFKQWRRQRNFTFARNDTPFLLYLFNEKTGRRVLDHSGAGRHLSIPARMQVLKTKMLSFSARSLRLDKGSFKDNAINFIGFVPMGLVMMATFVKAGSFFKKHAFWMSLGLCFSVSLAIEILQAWMPARSSDLSDLVLNTLGALVGILIMMKVK